MLRTSVALSARGYGVLRYAPTNLLINPIRTRRGLKWGIPAMVLAAVYFYAAAICTTIVNDGGPGWLYLLVLLFVWNAFKFLWIGPVSFLLMVRSNHLGAESACLNHERRWRVSGHGGPLRDNLDRGRSRR